MNRYLILFIIVFVSLDTAAQYQYIPLPLSNAQWRHRTKYTQVYSIHVMDLMFIATGADTQVNGYLYKKLLQRGHTESGYGQTIQYPSDQPWVADAPDKLLCLIREENKKVYEYISGSENLIYDFNLSIGDTIPKYFTYQYAYVIRSIDTVTMFNALRRRFKAAYIAAPYDTITITEGLGSDRGLILPGSPPANPVVPDTFYCLTAPGIDYNPHNRQCYYIWPLGTPSSISNTSNEKLVSIYPNPFTDAVSIDSREDGNVVLYNAMGAVVAKQSITTGHNTVNTSALSNGVYFMVLKDESGTVIHKEKLIK